jgi:hypothetical protein
MACDGSTARIVCVHTEAHAYLQSWSRAVLLLVGDGMLRALHAGNEGYALWCAEKRGLPCAGRVGWVGRMTHAARRPGMPEMLAAL